MNSVYKYNSLCWSLGKFSYYFLPIVFLLSCGSIKNVPHYGLFEEWDFGANDCFENDTRANEEVWYMPIDEECILMMRDDTIHKNSKTRKSIAYPERDIHELHPYIEEIPVETDSLKNK